MNILRAIALLAASASIATAQPIAGLWDGTVMVNGVALPFRVQFSGAGAASKAWFFNGDERIISTSADFAPAAVNAHFDQYNSRLELTLKNGALEGAYTRDG
ncbi:MAG TPA: hypothetical protein VG297_17685, partial [Bryobacteraceae bacterium]|nr:hypothetical protein [Bryobacteraceae bacterium]